LAEDHVRKSLAPALLVSMPQLTDPNFSRTVILLCQHSKTGAFGIVVNRPLVTTGQVVVNVQSADGDLPEPATTLSTDRELKVWIGGPVEPQRSWILFYDHAGERHEERRHEEEGRGTRVTDELYLSTSPDLLQRLLEADPPSYARLVVGYAGWGPGQLEDELNRSAWLLSDVDRELIFSIPAERMWEAAIRRLGADPATLHASRGVH
jgi:putative transcriptional regulator